MGYLVGMYVVVKVALTIWRHDSASAGLRLFGQCTEVHVSWAMMRIHRSTWRRAAG